ncbi:LysR family transcriptional regulator [Allosediminivita pacifica]|uniref:DNA-binding transcriptional LysR family regulator n=1 Tax=Allosediminivita pacifica TaxID=1267769 RepID=A0A2T6AUG2_9RHOB|nr:LysR family transcriptional regulator [Allosediminivita pacifica]PTX47453.1 DNA-binding transcriptional LysR family regulator [Allosediminivita pacifica]GGB14328.1 transcriptional regulator [Allosediminivita pacifica]
MIPRNLRHLRAFHAAVTRGSLSGAAQVAGVSQPAVTQSLRKLEEAAGGALLSRTGQGVLPTERGEVLAARVARAFARLDPALAEIAPKLPGRVTLAQLRALMALGETENFTLAAGQLGLSQPSVHRAVTRLEQEAGQALLERRSHGIVLRRPARALVQAARLALAELDQAEADLAALDGRAAGQIVVGALPLARSALLPTALARFREEHPGQSLKVIDGPYDTLLAGLRRGDIDLILGALRDPAPIGDVVQERLFDDRLCMLAGREHALVGQAGLTAEGLRDHPWIVPRAGTPARDQFNAFFAGVGAPERIIESGSVLLMRELLRGSGHLGCISAMQAEAEVQHGLLVTLDVAVDWPARPIGLSCRADWVPTRAQALLLTILRETAAG